MLLESLILGGIALNTLFTLTPELIGLGERVTDTKNFTINVVSVGPEVTVVELVAPSKLDPGKVPTVTVTVRHNRKQYEWLFARIIDADNGQIVCPMKRQYVQEIKDFTFTFQGLGPTGGWAKVMPNRAWNLQMEVGLWWV